MKQRGLSSLLLIGLGTALLIVVAFLAYPYVHSRLVGPSPMPAPRVATQGPVPIIGTPSPFPATPSSEAWTTEADGVLAPSPAATPVIVSAFIPAAATLEPHEPEPHGANTAPPTRIVIPSLSVDAPVVQVSWYKAEIDGQIQAAWEVPDAYAAGWHETSSPLGVPGNTVLNGHNTTNGEVFRDLYKLKPGDDIVLYSEEISHTYAVSRTLILPEVGQPLEVRLENARYVMPTDDERLTLVTCHPYGSLRNRLIVIAQPSGQDRATRNATDTSPEPLK
jgi:sortase A